MPEAICPGATVYCVDLSGLPTGKAAPFALDAPVVVERVSATGALLIRDKEGFWKPRRFSLKPRQGSAA